ncbi:MAG: protein kinase [Polyangiaceae bacterium]
MGEWTCVACGATGSEFDADCPSCGGTMPALSIEADSLDGSPFADPMIGRAVGRLRVLARIGGGAMGAVYEAADPASGRRVALKLLLRELLGSPEARARFADEALAASRIESPHVVRIFDHGVWEGVPFIAMQRLEGEDLAARLARTRRLSAEATLAVVTGAARGLAAAHTAGIIHRDLKPENLFLAREEGREVVKILDFGIAKHGAVALSERARTQTGALLGTPHYMSPEQADGTRSVDHRADLWSLAVIAFRCLTGELPFESPALGDLLMRIMSYPLPVPSRVAPDLPPAVDAWWAKAAARDPAMRFATAPDTVSALHRALLPEPSPLSIAATQMATRSTPPGAPPPSVSERQWVSAALTSSLGESNASVAESLAAIADRHGAHLDAREDGSLAFVVSLSGSGARPHDAATDLAVRAARCALSARELLPDRSFAVVTGRSGRRGDIGDLVTRSAALLDGPHIRVDEPTRHLLEARFEIDPGGAIAGERDDEAETRMILGRPVPFVGRARELDALRAMFEECESAPVAQAAIVLGVPGVGKSRLRQELLAWLRDRPRPPAVWIARGDAVSAGSPFGMIARALRREAGLLDGEPIDAQRDKLSARFGPSLPPAVRARTLPFLGELCDVPFSGDASIELRAARQSPVLMGDHIHAAFEELISAEQADRPVVLVLEDLQWGDRPSIDLLDGALRNLPDARLFVLALSRPELSLTFGEVWSDRRVQSLRLGELLPRQSEELVRAVLGDGIDGDDLARIVDRAAGNAFFLGELARSFAEGERDVMPETVLAMLGARIEQLDPVARRVLRAASLFGESFWIEGVRALLGDDPGAPEIEAAIQQCVRREAPRPPPRLAPRRPDRGRLPPRPRPRRRRSPRPRRRPQRRPPARRRLARTRRRARHGPPRRALRARRRPPRAALAYRTASASALEGNDFAAAIDRAERAVAAGAEGEPSVFSRRIQAEAHACRDERELAKIRGREAMCLLRAGSADWCAAVVESNRANTSQTDIAHLRSATEQLLAHRPDPPEPHHVMCASRVVAYLHGIDLHDEAASLLAWAEALSGAPTVADTTALGWLHNARAWSAFVAGDPAASLREEELAAAAFDRAGDARSSSYIRVGLGHSYREVGAFESAERVLRTAIHGAQRLNLPNVIRGAQYTLSSVLLLLGKLPEARALATSAFEGFLEQGDARNTGYSRIDLARILAAQGELTAAAEVAAEAESSLEIIPTGRAYALGVLASVRLRQGDLAGAQSAADSATRILTETGSLPEGENLVRLACAEVLLASAAPSADLRAALTAARDTILRRAERIADPSLRRSFLEDIPENARTLALARDHLPA